MRTPASGLSAWVAEAAGLAGWDVEDVGEVWAPAGAATRQAVIDKGKARLRTRDALMVVHLLA
jgi:hypothetical protein